MKKKLLLTSPLILVLVLVATVAFYWPTLKVGTAFKAKGVGSAVFVSGRDAEEAIESDFSFPPLNVIKATIDDDERMVTATFFGLAASRALYRDGIGCALVNGATAEELKEQGADHHPPPRPDLRGVDWPAGGDLPVEPLPPEVDVNAVNAAMDDAFSEPFDDMQRGTRAIVVVYKNRIVAEQYAEHVDVDMPLTGWSMTKGITNALVGVLVHEGKLRIKDPAPVPEWQEDPGDPRAAITLDQLLRMSSGLAFSEIYEDHGSDVVQMLYRKGDAGKFAAAKASETAPDARWAYSSGTTNVIAGIIRRTVGGSDAAFFDYPRRALFAKIGMHSALIEPDASGVFVGSSFGHATARDWARFGLLYLHDGVWLGERILPEGWVEYSTTPTPGAPEGGYGAHWWLNQGEPDDVEKRPWPTLPPDTYAAMGYETQRVLIIPSRDLVIVRLGLSRPERAFDVAGFANAILDAIGTDAHQP